MWGTTAVCDVDRVPPSVTRRAPTTAWWAAGVRTVHREQQVSHGRPAWAAFTERACAHVPPGRFPGGTWEEGFAFALRPLVRAATARDRRFRDDFARDLGLRLARTAARTLVVELHRWRLDGRLRGLTSRDRFASFVEDLRPARLFAEYPVLARLLGQTCLQAVRAHREVLDHLADDRVALVAALMGGRDPGPLVGVSTSGDRHGGGRAVAVLTFADGRKVVHRPRPVEQHALFADLLDWYGGRTGLDLRVPPVLVRPGYGWVAFTEGAPCADVTDLDRFYHRLGGLLALLHAVDATDAHYENLIACGDQPVLVDVETLFQPTTGVPADPAARALARSVQRTAVLPSVLLGEHGAQDVGGVGGDAGDHPGDGVRWVDAGTDRMRLERGPVPVVVAGNRPVLDGRPAEPAEHTGALLAGFRLGYDALCSWREELLERVRGFAGAPVRYVPRSTRVYAELLDESTHPDALRRAPERDLALELLREESGDDRALRALVPHEVADLWAGDVPLFTTRPESVDVWTSVGERLPGVLDEPVLAAVERKIAGLDEVDRHDQEWVIAAALACRPAEVAHRTGGALRSSVGSAVPDPRRLLVAACGVADEVLARSLVEGCGSGSGSVGGFGGGRVNWIGLELVEDRHWAVAPMGAGLSNGYTGVALFLAQVGALTGASRYTGPAREALAPVPGLLARFEADPELALAVGVGGFHGMGGICYALARVGRLLGDDPEIAGWLASAVRVLGIAAGIEPWEVERGNRGPARGGRVQGGPGRGSWGSAVAGGGVVGGGVAGVVEGWAGGVAALVAVAEAAGGAVGAEALRVARVLAERLLAADVRGDGFARGRAGVGWALLRYARAAGDERCAVAGRALLRADRALRQRLVDVREADHSWCSGLSGALLAHTGQVGQAADAHTLHVDRCLNALAVHEPLRDLSLCHGELGVVEAVAVLAERGHDRAEATRSRRAGVLLGALEQGGARCGTPGGVPSAGLLTGLAGIGYGLLRLGFPTSVPSALLLENR
ncbi:type 2 lantipeptide synthetase LanM family protein [Actinosynnema pretiosum subsp. pretiosum]|uniref:Type 2 lantipeptide synthetase LanM family protein n=1 Tax=Actinosynnema pretiosum subsp. pretiosum TaxID=103721 RepID=A0AA45R3B2_9PSEU|nr:type 2 lantipeptide synthetase LanM family protein [Actinosynnema pretiosum subsp. pretiosum]